MRYAAKFVLLTGVAAAALASAPASAEDGAPQGKISTGNALNSTGVAPNELPGPSTISLVRVNPRSPTGLLYPRPALVPEMRPFGNNGWTMRGVIEGGYLFNAGGADRAGFREFSDFSEDPILNRFVLRFEKPQQSRFVNFTGGAVGRDDQYYSLTFGKYNLYRANAWFTSTPHVFASNARVLWDGAGTGNLTLPAGLTPGASSVVDVTKAFQSIGESEISLTREEGGFALSYMPLKTLTLEGAILHEWRQGGRPFGGAFTYPGLGQVNETIEPIDYRVLDWRFAIKYVQPRFQANLTYSGSRFENDIDSLTFENPGLSLFQNQFTAPRGRFALAPDNQYHSFRGDLSAQFTKWNGRWTLTANYSISKQNESLLPPGVNGNPEDTSGLPVDLSLWNTVAALSRETADARFDRFTLVSVWSAQPSGKIRLTATLRYEDQNNKTDYSALNPLTGEYGYLALDGGLSGSIPSFSRIFETSDVGRRVRYRSMPFEKDTFSLKGIADYRFSRRMRANISFEHRKEDRAVRERKETREDRIGLEFVHRKMGKYTLRVSYNYSDRGGNTYIPNPYEAFYTSSLPGFVPRFPDGNPPHTLDEMRKFDLANRKVHLVKAKANFTIGEAVDLMFSGQYQSQDFDAEFGLKNVEIIELNTEFNFQLDTSATVYAFYSYQDRDRVIANINDTGFGSSDGSAGGVIFPLDGAWEQANREKHHTFGAGYSKRWRTVTLKLDYVFTRSVSRNRQSFNSTAAFFNQFSLSEVGEGLPNIEFENHLLTADVDWAVSKAVSLRLLYRLESEDIKDFHYQGLKTPVIGNDIFLAAFPQDFTAHVVGAFVRLGF